MTDDAINFPDRGHPNFVYPQDTASGSSGSGFVREGGLSLRDYFAAQAIVAAVDDYATPKQIAEEAYLIADAMMIQREIKDAKT